MIAEPLYLTKYIERMGTGIRDMIRRCRATGLSEPDFHLDGGVWVTTIWRKAGEAHETGQVTVQVAGQVTGQVTGQVLDLLKVVSGEQSKKKLMAALGLYGRDNFEKLYLQPALKDELVEMTQPNKPHSRLQKYRLTPKGQEILAALKRK